MWQNLDRWQKLAVWCAVIVLLLFATWLSYAMGGTVT